jgi:RHS repeat-associated protein
VERYSYTAYGTLGIYDASGTVRTTSTYANRYTYTGREYDPDLNLYHFRARWYDPSTGGFISRDPLGYVDGMSMYRGYFAVTGMDPSGGLMVQDGFVLPRVGAPIAPRPPITPIRPTFPVPTRPVLPVTPRPTLPPSIPPSPATSGVARSIGVRVLCRPILVVAVAHDGYCVGEALAPYTSVPLTVWVCSQIYPDTIPGNAPQPQGEGPVNLPGPRRPNGKTCEEANMLPKCGAETFEASSAGAACRKCNRRGSQPGRSSQLDRWDEIIESTSFVFGTITHTTCKIGRDPVDAVMSGMCCVDSGGSPRWVERYKCAAHSFEND